MIVAAEHGYFVRIGKDGSIEINALLPTETTPIDMKLRVVASKAS
jgi:hypothetical protein